MTRLWSLLLLLPSLAVGAAEPLATKLAPLDRALAAMAADGADFPPALELHRQRAQILAAAAQDDCEAQLSAAQAEAALYLDSPMRALLPGEAIASANLRAMLAFARSQCGNDEDTLVSELTRAREEAIGGVEHAHAEHAWLDEAILRFNVAHYERAMGDPIGAAQTLLGAIEVDDAHGLGEDGADNRRILAQWSAPGAPLPPAAPAVEHIPLTFGWHPLVADIDATYSSTRFLPDGNRRTTFDASGQYRLESRRDGGFDARLSDLTLQSRNEVATDFASRLVQSLAELVVQRPVQHIGADGGYLGSDSWEPLVQQLQERAIALVSEEYATDAARRDRAIAAARETAQRYFAAPVLDASQAASHALDTAMWIGATLETGQLMTVDLNLPLEGLPGAVAAFHTRFRLNGRVPCTHADTEAPRCIEIDIEASPTDEELERVRKAVADRHLGRLAYWSSLHERLVLEPQTLLPHAIYRRHALYLQLGKETQRSVGEEWQRIRYPAVPSVP